MNSEQWRVEGYKTIFRDKIYLYRPLSGFVAFTEVDSGKWMQFNNINEKPWVKTDIEKLPERLQVDLNQTTYNCYCGHCGVGTCDFCAGIRKP